MIENITKATLEPYLNETFEIRFDDGGVVELKLIECTDNSKNDQEVFWFIFEGPQEKALPQRIYRFTHPQLGEVDLFIVPVSGGKKGLLHYQSLFNRIVDESEEN